MTGSFRGLSDRVDAALALAPAALEGNALTSALQQVAEHLASDAARAQLADRQPQFAAGDEPPQPEGGSFQSTAGLLLMYGRWDPAP